MARRRKEQGWLKRNVLSIIIVAIMVFSGIGYFAAEGANDTGTWNGHRFTSYNGKWYTDIDGRSVAFSFHPADVQGINMSSEVIGYLNSTKMLYITFDPNASLVPDFEIMRLELETELPEYFGIYPVTGVSGKSEQYASFPVITCQNATLFVPVIYIRQGETGLIPEESCLIMQAREGYDVPAIKDRLLYGLFGLI
jgi:hypothetical protein